MSEIDSNKEFKNMIINLKQQIISNFDGTTKKYINNALKLASKVHTNQYRDEGMPYIIHPLRVANKMIEKGFDYKVCVAAILHDVVEDGNIELSKIKNEFDCDIAEMVDLLTKPKLSNSYEWIFANHKSFVKTTNQNYKMDADKYYNERSAIYYDRLINSGNIYAIYIKLYDNLDNIVSLENVSIEKRTRNINNIVRHTFWLANKFLNKDELDLIKNILKKYKIRLSKTSYKSVKLKNPIVVLPPRNAIDSDFYHLMPLSGTKCITIYGNIQTLFLSNCIEVGLPNDKDYFCLLTKWFNNYKITKQNSLLPNGLPTNEQIYNVEGFRKEFPLIKTNNKELNIKTSLGLIKINNYNAVDITYTDFLKDLFMDTKQEYKIFKANLEKFFDKYVKN